MSKYQEVAGWILEQIDSGVLSAGSKIPSENELCEKFHISRQTVRHAIAKLSKEGVLRSAQGSGTYVDDYKLKLSKRIAVVTTYVDGYIFPKTIQGIESTLKDYGYSMQLSFTNNTYEREREILENLIAQKDTAGLLLEPTKSALPSPNIDLIKKLEEQGTRILLINSYYQQLPIPHVSLDDKKCSYLAVKALIEAGHTKIGCILKLDDGQGRERYLGYLEAMKEMNFAVDDKWIVWLDTDDLGNMEENTDKIKRRINDCTALFIYNDQVAVEVISLLQKNGKKVPDDMSIVSIDDSDLAHMNGLSLDSIPHPKQELGEKAAENLIHLIHNSSFDATWKFTETLNKRGSIRNIKKI